VNAGKTARRLLANIREALTLAALIACAASCGQSHPKPTIDLSGRSSAQARVGGSDTVEMTVKNTGSQPFSLLVVYLNGKDDWFKHHVITDPAGCTIHKSLERLECGGLAAGETKTLTIVGSPKDAGNFDFEVGIVDEEGDDLLYPDRDALEWSEVITP
jgi:hypothetical protein